MTTLPEKTMYLLRDLLALNYRNCYCCLLLALWPLAGLAQAPAASYVQVRQLGATGQKSQDATAIIQKGIDQVSRAGGGVLYFGPGQYTTATVILKDNVTLYLEAGAEILASRKPEDYAAARSLLGAATNTPGLFYAKGVRNIRFAGLGTVNGQAEHVWQDMKETDSFIARETENARASGVEMKRAYALDPKVSLFYLQECQNVRLEGITITASPHWGVHVQWSQDVFISNIRLFSSLDKGVNSDGIDIDGCRNVTVSDCIIATGDDAICLKSTNKGGRFEPVENVTVTNCVLTSTSAALKIGTETFGDFRHIVFNNCVIRDTNRGLGIFVRDGATVEDVIFSNITLETRRKHFNWWGDGDAFRFVVLQRTPSSKVGVIRNVLVENIIGHSQGTSLTEGFAGTPLEHFTFRNVQLFMHPEEKPDKRATSALRFQNIRNLKIENTDIIWDKQQPEARWRQALEIKEVEGLSIHNFSGLPGRSGQNLPAIELTDVQHARLTRLDPANQTTPLLKVNGARSRNIRFEGTKGSKQVQRSASVPKNALLIGK